MSLQCYAFVTITTEVNIYVFYQQQCKISTVFCQLYFCSFVNNNNKLTMAFNKNKKETSFPMDLQFYQFRLSGSCGYSDCLDAVLERLNLIQLIHQTKIDKNELKLDEQLSYLIQLLKSTGDSTFLRLLQSKGRFAQGNMKDRRKDYMSFFFLNWTMCDINTNIVTQWWYEGELHLFKLRALLLDDMDVIIFVHINELSYKKITKSTAQLSWKNNLQLYGDNLPDDTIFFVVPTKEVRDLIRRRLVLHRGDKALLTPSLLRSQLDNCYSDILKAHWMDSLIFVKSEAAKDITIKKIIQVVKKEFYASPRIEEQLEFLISSSDSVEHMCCHLTDLNIDEIAKNLFPPCMQTIHERLRKKHHLKYFNRTQLTTFLKNIGMSFENVVLYLRNEFTKKMTDEKFDREYLYHVKHTYGLVGKKVPYPPNACKFLLKDPSAFGESNCCSFVDDIEDLHKKMCRENIPEKRINAIKNCAASGKYGLACSKYFAARYRCEEPAVMEYPVNYVQLSMQAKNISLLSLPISTNESSGMLQSSSGLKAEPGAI